jgi:uncharacterized membrane protein YedE/YeeE
MARKMNKKTRNTLSGILVGVASVFAVINFADIPADDIRTFIVATVLFFVAIVILALLAVTCFKLLGALKHRIAPTEDEPWLQDTRSENESGQDTDKDDKT